MDVAELRIAFNLSETIAERIRRFNIDRASKILSGETAVPLYDNAKIALHLVPFISFNPVNSYTKRTLTMQQYSTVRSIRANHYSPAGVPVVQSGLPP